MRKSSSVQVECIIVNRAFALPRSSRGRNNQVRLRPVATGVNNQLKFEKSVAHDLLFHQGVMVLGVVFVTHLGLAIVFQAHLPDEIGAEARHVAASGSCRGQICLNPAIDIYTYQA